MMEYNLRDGLLEAELVYIRVGSDPFEHLQPFTQTCGSKIDLVSQLQDKERSVQITGDSGQCA